MSFTSLRITNELSVFTPPPWDLKPVTESYGMGVKRTPLFFHCNPRHHSLAVMPPFADIPPGTFNHLMLQGRSINDVGIAYDPGQGSGNSFDDGAGKAHQ